MTNSQDFTSQFQEIKKYKVISLILIFSSMVPILLFIYFSEGWALLGFMFSALLIAIAWYISLKYSCPACNNKLDLRSDYIQYCSSCGVQLEKEK